jgi:FAD/FMN-containing dehydrogenase
MPSSEGTTQPPAIIWRDTAEPGEYEQARTRRLFNGIVPKRYPAAILFAKTEHDIIGAVKLAIEKDLRISIRAGGHSYPAWSVWDDALLLDLGEYSELDLEPGTGTVRLSPSVTGRELDRYLVAKGRAFPGGHCPDVAMGGYLLGGGMGWNTNVSVLYDLKHGGE